MSRTRIIFATGNAGKVREIKDIVGHMGIEVLTMREAGVETDPLEDGTSFEENALIKARSVAALVRKAEEEGRMEGPGQGVMNIVMSDDSGLVVDALGGAPGIYSARFQGRDTDYRVKMNYIMDQLRDVPWEGRTARFTAAVAAVLPDGRALPSWAIWKAI